MSRLVSIPLDAYPADALKGLSPGPFSLGAARAAMWLAQLAYEEEEAKIRTVMARWSLDPLLIFDRPGGTLSHQGRARGFVARGGGLTITSFGGTDPLVLANWITDFRIARNAAGAHVGFVEALDIMWDEIAAALRAQPAAPLLFTGHSLGASLALLCAGRALAKFGLAPAAVYGFGMPRSGDAGFAARLNAAFGDRVYRLAHGEDMVPSVPPARLGFCHVGRFLHCASHTKFEAAGLSPAPSLLPDNGASLAESVVAALRGLLAGRAPAGGDWKVQNAATRLLPLAVSDHLPDRYWNALATE